MTYAYDLGNGQRLLVQNDDLPAWVSFPGLVI